MHELMSSGYDVIKSKRITIDMKYTGNLYTDNFENP